MLKSTSLLFTAFPKTPITLYKLTCRQALLPLHKLPSANKTDCKSTSKNYKSKMRPKKSKKKENLSKKREVEVSLQLYPNSRGLSSNKINRVVKILLIALKIVLYQKLLTLLIKRKFQKRLNQQKFNLPK
jgi:hypothetical protein